MMKEVEKKGILPKWAPRIPKWKIRHLYNQLSKGIFDDELINDVGYSLLSRCKDFIKANNALKGIIYCPICSKKIDYKKQKGKIINCSCSWKLTWEEYHKTIKKKQLSGAQPVIEIFKTYIRDFSKATTVKEKIILIDNLIHKFHIYIKDNSPTRPVAINLIEGRLKDVIRFLDNLTYGLNSFAEMKKNKKKWNDSIRTAKKWC